MTCSISGSLVEWMVLAIPENETTAVRYFRHFFNDQSDGLLNETVKSVLFTFSRVSPSNTQPLMTRLVTGPANSDINGTEVICLDRGTRISASTTVNIISKDLDEGRLLFII